MKDPKKDEFWATSVRRFLSDGEDCFNEVGEIFLNLRDMTEINKVIDALVHELGHLIDNKSSLKRMTKEILKLKEISGV